MLKNRVEGLYEILSQNGQEPQKYFTTTCFELRDGKLYFRDKNRSLMTRDGKLRSIKEVKKILGDRVLRDLDFYIPKVVTAEQTAMLNKVEEEILLHLM